MPTQTDQHLLDSLSGHGISLVTSVPCKQPARVIAPVETSEQLLHVPSNKHDQRMALCAAASIGVSPT